MRSPLPPITSRTNARVKVLRLAFTGRASQSGELVGIEGATLIEEAIGSGLEFETLFVRQGSEEAISGEMIDALGSVHTAVLSKDVFESMVDTASPQEIAATVKIPAAKPYNMGAQRGMLLVLEDIQDPGNLGTLIRSAEAFGAEDIFLTPGSANHWSPKVIRASAGSVFRARVHRMPIREALQLLRRDGVRIAGAVAQSEDAASAPFANLQRPIALLIGNEGTGLSREALYFADERVHIPCRTESLNAAIAGSLLLYEAQRQNAVSSTTDAALEEV